MKIQKRKKPRKFKVGINEKIVIKDCGNIYLQSNEQITFKKDKFEYDICKTNWGYYGAPSMNHRLKNFNFKSFLTINRKKRLYIMLVEKQKLSTFKRYLKKEKVKILKEFTNS